jgi:elongator complex protein 3
MIKIDKKLALKDFFSDNIELIKNSQDLAAKKRKIIKKHKIEKLLNSEIMDYYRLFLKNKEIKRNFEFEGLLKKRAIRTMSGIAPVAVLTKAYPCPGECAYCPLEKDVPVSYLSNEPAVMRAIRCDYDPYKQVILRLKALEKNGHEPNKIELIVIGGTWSYLPKKYQYFYILNCYKAVNDYKKISQNNNSDWSEAYKQKIISPYKEKLSLDKLKKNLKKEQVKNEKSDYKIIGLTLETRPDYINKEEVIRMREFCCTRVELGVQAIDDEILKKNKRGHGVKEVYEATKLLKRYGFKITYHIMPALPGSSPEKDLSMFKALFSNEKWQPDQIKFYPTVVTKNSLLYKWYKKGKYKPYSDKELQELIIKCKALVPKYVRIIRLIRDIPNESIIAGNKITNLRQIMQEKGVKCQCIRCRESRDKIIKKWCLEIEKYSSVGGIEYFISINSLDKKILYGFCRLRLDKKSPVAPAIIRELHVYGQLVPVGKVDKKTQHQGLGKELMKKAESIAKDNNHKKIAVISGVGVRGYYRKLNYHLKNTYMIKFLIK